MQYLSYYVSEITLIDENYLQYLPSVKAAAAITLAMFTIRYSHYCDIANGNLGKTYKMNLTLILSNCM